MAKKKANPQSNNNKPPKSQYETPTDDAASDKLHSLKSLNSMLLKETVERRQQVDSLTQVNTSLQFDLNQCISELNFLTEQAVKLDIEKGVSSRFVAVQVIEMTEERVSLVDKISALERDLNAIINEKSEIERVNNRKESEIDSLNSRLSILECEIGEEKFILSRVCEERDAIRAQIEDRIQIENVLRSKLDEAEKRGTVVSGKSEKVKVEYDGLLKEKALVETKMYSIIREKESIKKSLIESNGLIDDLKRDMNTIAKEKAVIVKERDLQEKKKNELQESVDRLNELVYKLQQGKVQLVNKVVELEKKCVESLDKEANTSADIEILVKEKHDMEVEIERLTQEKSLVAKDFDEALNSLRKQNLNIGQLVNEKAKINDAKNQAETDIIKFKEQLEELKKRVKTLDELSVVQTDKIKQLESENSRYIAASDQATKGRNNARASLDGEKDKVKHLTDTISKMEKDIKDVQKKLSEMQKETEKLVLEKNDLENTGAVLANEILAVTKSIAKTQKEHDDTKGKLRLSEANTCRILKILKKTSLICNSKEDDNMGIDQETEYGEEIKHHVKEVEAIKKAFKDKESIMDEMKKQLGQLKVRVAKADKGKSFWTMVSSATTVLAAVSLAYVARGGY